MPTNTPNLNLTTYDVATEGSVLFISAWENLIGTLSTSNMNKLDGFAGTTTATLQLLQDRPGSTHISATTADGVNYTATVSGLTSLSSGMIIYLEPDDVNTGNPYLNINSLGNKTMYKIDVDGVAIQLEPGDLIPTRKILLVYDGFSWYATGGINLSDYKISGAIDSLIAIGSSNQPVASSIVLSGGKIGAESIKFDSTLNKDVNNNLMLGESGITAGTYKGTTYDKYGRATDSSDKVRGSSEIFIKDGVTDNLVSINSTDGIVDSGFSAKDFGRPVFLTTPLTSTDWDGDSFSTTYNKTLIDLSTVFGVPAGVKAILVRLDVSDSGSSSGLCQIGLSPNNTPNSVALQVYLRGVLNGAYVSENGIVPCDANGDIYYQILASGTGTFSALMQIWGYWL
jgi:hypothetical protein